MSDSRAFGVLLGAAVLVAALFAPWYAIDLGGAARDAISQSTGQLPAALGEFARGMLAILPDRIVANGWQVFEKTDIVLLCCALGAAFAALLGRFDVAALAGGAAAITTVVVMLNRPGPEGVGSIVQMQWGPWVALAGAALIVLAARIGGREAAPAAPLNWSTPAEAAEPAFGDPATSVAPPR
jgi:hypothetical protein